MNLLFSKTYYMSSKNSSKNTSPKSIVPKDNQGNQQNPNKGTPGANKQYDQGQGNRGKQMNPTQTKKGK
jgi:hypothetical protein